MYVPAYSARVARRPIKIPTGAWVVICLMLALFAALAILLTQA